MEKVITMAHGSGGRATGELISAIFAEEFNNDVLNKMEDAAAVDGSRRIAMTTDSFVVTPVEYPGGDIGRLCVCGTVNDLLSRGAIPQYLTCGFILEEGLEVVKLKRIVHSMAETAREANVTIVAGDTKVVEGKGGLYINTAGVGFFTDAGEVSAEGAKPGDSILVSGTLGEHHATILGHRMNIENDIKSDNAPLNDIVESLLKSDVEVHVLRDVTRGGLATVLKELAKASGNTFVVEDEKIPVSPQVRDFCGLLGLDPYYMGNEGKIVCIVKKEDEAKALEIMKNAKYGEDASVIGHVEASKPNEEGSLYSMTSIGGMRNMDILQGEGLPRIC
ncbi:MAG: hydrogenase expression/formation protein HypE [Lachnospiraceae bacterium]|nr:hydrogenase expression/formation protein HypE [Lachnospiraceae bacterium]